jgi:hypothetical protein
MRTPNDATDVFKYIVMGEPDACWPWLGSFGGQPNRRRPYIMVEGKRYIAYRLVFELVHGSIDKKLQVQHSCDNGAHPIGCCNPAHLKLGTNQTNADDMMERERHGLPKNVVKAIRALLDKGRLQHEIADLYGISRESVSAIATGRTYTHVPSTEAEPLSNITVVDVTDTRSVCDQHVADGIQPDE